MIRDELYIYLFFQCRIETIIHTKDPSTIDESEGSDRSCFRDNETKTKTKKQRQKKNNETIVSVEAAIVINLVQSVYRL